MKTHIVYLVTNRITGKQYIGITGSTIIRRWQKHLSDAKNKTHNMLLHAAIRKYGKENFFVEHIATSKSWENACATEVMLIQQHNTFRPNGYNLTLGGEGTIGASWTEDAKQRFSKSKKGTIFSAEHKQNLSIAWKNRKQHKPITLETKLKLSEAAKGHPVSEKVLTAVKARNADPEFRKKFRERFLGKPRSEETREKMRQAWVKRRQKLAA